MESTSNKTRGSRGLTALAITLCVIFGLMLIINVTIIIKGMVNPDEPPSIFGTTPLVVMSGSMSGDAKEHIEVGDLIFIKDVKFEELKVGDVITYELGRSYTTHRIVREGVDEKTGERIFYTQGDANNTEDTYPVYKSDVVGVYRGARAPWIGSVILFTQKPVGMITMLVVPVIVWVICDAITKRKYDKESRNRTAELEAEIERLRAAQGKSEDEQ